MDDTKQKNSVRLLGIPEYYQGSVDGLCAYYAGAMMLAAFYPYYAKRFGDSNADEKSDFSIFDPFISNYTGKMAKGPRMSKNMKHRAILSRWFYAGADLDDVTKTLNKIVENSPFSTHFSHGTKTATNKTYGDICDNIDRGLPVLFGWDTKDLGCHAVLIVGYWTGSHRWFAVQNPGGESDVSWEMLKDMKQSNFEVVTCDTHTGPRPDMLVEDDSDSATVYRWTEDQSYEDLEMLFAPTNY